MAGLGDRDLSEISTKFKYQRKIRSADIVAHMDLIEADNNLIQMKKATLFKERDNMIELAQQERAAIAEMHETSNNFVLLACEQKSLESCSAKISIARANLKDSIIKSEGTLIQRKAKLEELRSISEKFDVKLKEKSEKIEKADSFLQESATELDANVIHSKQQLKFAENKFSKCAVQLQQQKEKWELLVDTYRSAKEETAKAQEETDQKRAKLTKAENNVEELEKALQEQRLVRSALLKQSNDLEHHMSDVLAHQRKLEGSLDTFLKDISKVEAQCGGLQEQFSEAKEVLKNAEKIFTELRRRRNVMDKLYGQLKSEHKDFEKKVQDLKRILLKYNEECNNLQSQLNKATKTNTVMEEEEIVILQEIERMKLRHAAKIKI